MKLWLKNRGFWPWPAGLRRGAHAVRGQVSARELRAAGLFPPPMEIGTRDRIGQTSSAVALGGLRTLVATFLNLRAFTFFTEQRWDDVEDTFDTIVDLAPRTRVLLGNRLMALGLQRGLLLSE